MKQRTIQTMKATMNNQQIEIAKRLHKGNQIFHANLVKWIRGDYYEVRSQTNPNLIYGVDAINKLCDCEDFQRNYPNICKHWYAVNLFRIKAIKKITPKIKVGIVQ